MNANTTHTPRTSSFVRRAVPALAIVVLAVGLGACQTPARGQAAPQAEVIQQVQEPVQVGFDRTRPADRMAEEIERLAARNAQSPSARFRGMPADRVEEQLAREADRFDGMPADRVVEQLEREAAGAPVFY